MRRMLVLASISGCSPGSVVPLVHAPRPMATRCARGSARPPPGLDKSQASASCSAMPQRQRRSNPRSIPAASTFINYRKYLFRNCPPDSSRVRMSRRLGARAFADAPIARAFTG